MLQQEPWEDGGQVRLPVDGAARALRILPALFLGLWLCGWAMGEYFAGGMLLGALRDRLAPGLAIGVPQHAGTRALEPLALVFLGVWVAFWTAGGVIALGSVAGLLFGTPTVRWDARDLEFLVEVGPFSRRRRVPLAGITDVRPGPLGTLTVSGVHGRLSIGPVGDPADSARLAGWIDEARHRAASEPAPVRAIA